MKYKTILADPPWKIGKMSKVVRPFQGDMPYSMMSLPQIKRLEVNGVPIRDLADDDAHLYLWTTHTWLPYAFEVLSEWGFSYHCTLTWDKTYGFTPFSFMWSTEFCLFGYKNWVTLKKIGEKTLVREKPCHEHSRKPAAMYDLIERVSYPPYLELFARPHSPLFPIKEGWDVWGEEVNDELGRRAKEMDCVCGNTDGDNCPMCVGADGGTCEEHTTGTADMVAEPVGGGNDEH